MNRRPTPRAAQPIDPDCSGSVAGSQSIEWYHEGQVRTVEVGGVPITVRMVGRKGRRARIAITAPSGVQFAGRQADGKLPIAAPPNCLD